MNKSDIIRAYGKVSGLNLDEAKGVVADVMLVMRKGLMDDGILRVDGIGTLEVQIKKSYIGKHPKTGEVMEVPDRKQVSFRTAKAFKDDVNS